VAFRSKYLSYLTLLFLSGCANHSSNSYDKVIREQNLASSIVETTQFDLLLVRNENPRGDYLHVYIDGDGVPFHRNRYINPDPTSHQALSIKLLAQDPNESVFIGRPCYHQVSKRNCKQNQWWTSHRYSTEVVESIGEALLGEDISEAKVRLIGFSGGGSLAALLASQLEVPVSLVTINANLDINAWTQHHGYSPLFGSVNPIDRLEAASLKQLHLVGGQDNAVNHKDWLPRLKSISNSEVVEYTSFSHICCWEKQWGEILHKYLPNK